MDDAFLTNKKQAYEIFDAVSKEQLELKFYITASRPDDADEQLYKKMKQAGVIRIQYGLESGNQETLDFYHKKTTVEKIRYGVSLGHQAGLFTLGTFVVGAPFETKQHFDDTLKFAKSLPLDSVSFLSLRYMVGSDLWFDAVKKGAITSDEYFVLADAKRGLALLTQEEIDDWCRNAQRAFYYRPTYLMNLLRSSLERNDFTLLQILLSNSFSILKKQLLFWRKQQRGAPQPYRETTVY
jgi:radical SAM superfamily enzyme YgiQ (UPF0313 family)